MLSYSFLENWIFGFGFTFWIQGVKMGTQLDRIEARLSVIEEILSRLLEALDTENDDEKLAEKSAATLDNLDDNPYHYQSL